MLFMTIMVFFLQVAVKADLALRPPSAHLLLSLPRDLTLEGLLRQAKLRAFQPDFEAYGIETVRERESILCWEPAHE